LDSTTPGAVDRVANVPHQARLLVDDALWVDLVERGYPPGQVVWFYKLDTDRDIQAVIRVAGGNSTT
jgi:hypothetical protein